MSRHFKNFQVIAALAAVGMLLPLATFAQVKSVTTITSPTQTTQLNTVTGVVAPTISPTESVTTDVAKILAPTIGISAPTTQTQTTKVLSPTTDIVAPTKTVTPTTGIVAPVKTLVPATGIVAPTKTTAPTGSVAPQKTTTAFPFTPTALPRASDAFTTVSQYAAAQVIYRVEHIDLLLKVAEQRGEASAAPLTLDQLPGNPTIAIDATADGEFAVDIAGAGRYSVNATVYDIDRNAFAQFSGTSFVVPWTTYDDPASFVINIAYLPAATLTSVGGFPLPPPAGVVPVAPTTPTAPTKPVAVQPVAPVTPGAPSEEIYELTYSLVAMAPAPGEGGIVREIPPGEVPEEIISEEGEVPEPIAEEGIPEEEFELPAGEEPIEEPGIVERFGDFFGDLFGFEAAPADVETLAGRPEEGVAEEVTFEGEIAFEGDEGEFDDVDFFGVGEEEEGGEDFFAFEGEPEEAPGFDFTDFGISPDEFVGEEEVGDLGFGFDFGDLALAPEEEFAAEEEALPEEGVPGEEFFDGEPEEPFVEEEVGDLDLGLGDLTLAPEEEFVPEEEEFVFGEEETFVEELFTPDLSAPVIPDYGAVGDDIVVSVPLDDIFGIDETGLVASLVVTPVAGGRGLEFSEPIDVSDTVTFVIPRSVLAVLGDEMRVLLKTTATLNGLLIVSTDVLGVARNE